MDELFRLLVECGRLRSPSPERASRRLLRQHGELVRAGPARRSPRERLETMLLSIMTPREIGEFRETGDTDWAYEIDELARFRCNAGRDRHGPMAVFRVIPAQQSAPPTRWASAARSRTSAISPRVSWS